MSKVNYVVDEWVVNVGYANLEILRVLRENVPCGEIFSRVSKIWKITQAVHIRILTHTNGDCHRHIHLHLRAQTAAQHIYKYCGYRRKQSVR